MPISLLPLLASATQSIAQANTPSDPISFQTALLVIIAGAVLVLAKNQASLNRRLTAREASAASTSVSRTTIPAQSDSASTTSDSGERIAPHVVAAISAAIHTTLKGNLRIISVGEICPNRQAWSAEGRRQVFQSHKFR